MPMNVAEITQFLKLMVRTQASANKVKRSILESYNFSDSDQEILNAMFESVNQMINVNLNLTRSYRDIIRDLENEGPGVTVSS